MFVGASLVWSCFSVFDVIGRCYCILCRCHVSPDERRARSAKAHGSG